MSEPRHDIPPILVDRMYAAAQAGYERVCLGCGAGIGAEHFDDCTVVRQPASETASEHRPVRSVLDAIMRELGPHGGRCPCYDGSPEPALEDPLNPCQRCRVLRAALAAARGDTP